jgi:hypothetical protein
MQSFLTVQPGETFGCAGCHEHRTDAPRPRPQGAALARGPARIEPIADLPDVFDFPRDIQPILGRHCVTCHSADKPKGNVALDQPYPAYALLMDPTRALIAHGQDKYGNRPPRSIGTSASRLMEKIDGRHQKVNLTDVEKKTVMLWIETGAPYAGTYGSLGMHFQPSYAAADGFRPTAHYVREMKRYGILPESFDLGKEPIDCYAVDRAYWRSFWHRGASAPAGAGETALHMPGEQSAR